jgi:uncharacterized protein YjlB
MPPEPAAIERAFAANRWPPRWRDGVHPFHHFHANTHEVLGVASGTATVLFGGPNGRELTVAAGDVVAIPAGIGHCNIRQSDDLLMVGAYPDNAPRPDMHRDSPAAPERWAAVVARVAPPPALGAGLAHDRAGRNVPGMNHTIKQ